MSKDIYSHYIFGSGAEVPKAGALLALSHAVLKAWGLVKPSTMPTWFRARKCLRGLWEALAYGTAS